MLRNLLSVGHTVWQSPSRVRESDSDCRDERVRNNWSSTMTTSFKKHSVYVPRRELTLAERVEIIRSNQRGVRTGLIAERYNCSKQQVRRIIRRKKEYLALWAKSTNDEVEMVRRLRNPLQIATGRILYEWILRARYYMDITDDTLRQTGHEIAAFINYTEFKSNNKWLSRLKDKYKLHNMKLANFRSEAMDPRHMKSLNIGDIIETIKRDDPASLSEYFRELDAVERRQTDLTIMKKLEQTDEPMMNSPKVEDSDSDDGAGQEDGNEGSCSPFDQGIGMEEIEMGIENPPPVTENDEPGIRGITTYGEAVKLLAPLEDFALIRENIRAVGLLSQLEHLFKDEIAKGNA